LVPVTATFNRGGGMDTELQTVYKGETLTQPAVEPVAPAYQHFAGWWIKNGATWEKQWNFATDVITENITLHARFIENPSAIVTFDMGDDQIESTKFYISDGPLAEPATAPTRDGYTFDGWFLDDDYETPVTWPLAITTDTTIYAKWTPIPPDPTGGDRHNRGLAPAAIGGIIAGAIILLGAAAVFAIWCDKKKKFEKNENNA
jgi:uncharacterized repeat protein (TIGR02543 family)